MATFYQPPFFEEENALDLSVKNTVKRPSPTWARIENELMKRRRDSHNSQTSEYSRGSEDASDYKAVYLTDYRATVAVMQQHYYDDERITQVSPIQGSVSGTPEPFLPQQQAIHRTPEAFQIPQVILRTPEPNLQQSSPAGPSSHIMSHTDNTAVPVPNNKTKVKATRPFKAYPKNPLSLVAPMNGLVSDSDEEYAAFRQQMLERVYAATGGVTSNKNMKRPSPGYSPPSSSQDPTKDSSYRERRRKNNEAAKRSRDARRAKEDELAIRTAFLEQQNAKLTYEAAALREECNKLRSLVYATN